MSLLFEIKLMSNRTKKRVQEVDDDIDDNIISINPIEKTRLNCECGKTYVSKHALDNHIKLKHPQSIPHSKLDNKGKRIPLELNLFDKTADIEENSKKSKRNEKKDKVNNRIYYIIIFYKRKNTDDDNQNIQNKSVDINQIISDKCLLEISSYLNSLSINISKVHNLEKVACFSYKNE